MAGSILARYRQSGAWGLALAVLRRIPGVRVVCLYHVYELPVTALEPRAPDAGPPTGRGLELRDGRDALEDLVAVIDKRDLYRERLDRGDRCLICYADGRPAGFVWFQDGPVHREERLGFTVRFEPAEMYCFDFYVHEEFRRRGVAREMMRGMIHHAARRLDRRRLTCIIEVHNLRSRRANERIGWRRARFGYYAEAFGRAWERGGA